MCTPTAAVGGVLGLASMASNKIGADQANSARSDVLNEQSKEQQAYNNAMDAINRGSEARYVDVPGQMKATASNLSSFYDSHGVSPTAAGPTVPGGMPASKSAVTNGEVGKQSSLVSAYNTQQNHALADNRSFGDTMSTIGRGINLDRADLTRINGFKQGVAALLPGMLDNASRAGSGFRTAADFLKMGSQIGMSAGLAGGGPTWGSIGGLFGSSGGPTVGPGTGFTY